MKTAPGRYQPEVAADASRFCTAGQVGMEDEIAPHGVAFMRGCLVGMVLVVILLGVTLAIVLTV